MTWNIILYIIIKLKLKRFEVVSYNTISRSIYTRVIDFEIKDVLSLNLMSSYFN